MEPKPKDPNNAPPAWTRGCAALPIRSIRNQYDHRERCGGEGAGKAVSRSNCTFCQVRQQNDESRRACWTRRRGVWQFVLRQITRRTTSRGLGNSTVRAGRIPTGRTGRPLPCGVVVVGPTRVVRDADASRRARRLDASRPPLCTMAEWRGCTTLPRGARASSTASRPATRATIYRSLLG